MQQAIRFYARYYALLIYEIFRRSTARKRLWMLYWEITVWVNDRKRTYSRSRRQRKEQKAINEGLNLCRLIMDHLIKVEGGSVE